jgi:plastocyanin
VLAAAQDASITGRVTVVSTQAKNSDNSDVVAWLEPMGDAAHAQPLLQRPRLVQKNKHFEPHLLVVTVGTDVEFPNRDPFFHNVFSLFDGKRFDLGLYEAGESRTVRFTRAGVSYIFCNIHPQMSAVVVAVDTPYYAVSTRNGTFQIDHLPPGRYVLKLWYEGSSPESLAKIRREITVASPQVSVGDLRLQADQPVVAHKNKYGLDYDTSQSAAPYERH